MIINFLLFHGILDTMLSRKIQKAWCFYFCLWYWNISWYLKFTYGCFRKSIIVSLKKCLWYVKREKHPKRGGARVRSHLMTHTPLHPTVMQSQMFSKIGALKNFALFTEKHPCWKRLQLIWFSVNIAKFLRTFYL